MAFDNNYVDFEASGAQASAGKDIILAVYNADSSKLLAIAGQRGLSLHRSADRIDVTSKDADGWKSTIGGMKEWSMEHSGLYLADHAAHLALSTAFEQGEPVRVKLLDRKDQKTLFSGLAAVVDYDLDAPYDDAMTYEMKLEGNGALTRG